MAQDQSYELLLIYHLRFCNVYVKILGKEYVYKKRLQFKLWSRLNVVQAICPVLANYCFDT